MTKSCVASSRTLIWPKRDYGNTSKRLTKTGTFALTLSDKGAGARKPLGLRHTAASLNQQLASLSKGRERLADCESQLGRQN